MGDYRDNAKDYVAFVMLKRNRSTHSFAEYMDKDTGEVKSITQHIDKKTGQPVPRRFKWTSNQPVLKIPRKQEEVIEFIRNYPGCYKSKNAKNPDAPKELFIIAEINDASDAKLANDANKLNITAQAAAYDLELYPEKLARIARLVGEDSKIPSIQLFACINYAKSNAEKFMSLVNEQESEARDLVKQALSAGIIKKQGVMYNMGKVNVGTHNEERVIAKVSGSAELMEALKFRLTGEETSTDEDLPEQLQEIFGKSKEEDGRKEPKTKVVK